jgi:hypothetical protein
MDRRAVCIPLLALSLTVAFGASAAAEKPVVIPIAEVPFTFNAGFSPKRLPEHELAPIALSLSGKAAAADLPPVLREVVIEADRNIAIDASDLPVCTTGKLRGRNTERAEDACSTAIVGRGRIEMWVARPEQAPFTAKSKLVAFNRGVERGTTTILIHAYIPAPESASLVIRAKVSKTDNGRFGLKALAAIPQIADGYGSVRSFELIFDRGYKNTPFLFAKCPDGHLNAKVTSVFADSTHLTGSFVRSCTAKPAA